MADTLQMTPFFPHLQDETQIHRLADSTNKYTNDWINKKSYNRIDDGYFIDTDAKWWSFKLSYHH